MLVRRIARPLLAAPFIGDGVDALRNPQSHVAAAAPIVEKVADTADKQLPVQLPKDTAQWVKGVAGVKVAAGVLFALGRFPRLSALLLGATAVPTALAQHRFWEATDPQEKANQTKHFMHSMGLLGGLLIASVDTEGKPSVGYRARKGAKAAAVVTEKSFEQASKRAAKAQRKAEKKLKKKR
ncbi:DoxX family protein [Blastococcus sp. SYSU DS0617]